MDYGVKKRRNGDVIAEFWNRHHAILFKNALVKKEKEEKRLDRKSVS
jgi:hypothetical protein